MSSFSFSESPGNPVAKTSAAPSNALLTGSAADRSLSGQRNIPKLVSKIEPQFQRLEIHYLNYCESDPVCNEMLKVMQETVPDAIQYIHDWLYISPVYEWSNGPNTIVKPVFTPQYPHVDKIIVHIGPSDYITDNDVVAYTEHSFNQVVNVYFSSIFFSKLEGYIPKSRRWRGFKTTIMHEMVHALQHGTNSHNHFTLLMSRIGLMCIGLPPRGLIEGIADFVPLIAGEHSEDWGKRPRKSSERGDKWDAGYLVTAYFLEWIERIGVGPGAVGLLNDRIGRTGYFREGEYYDSACRGQPDTWKNLFGHSVEELWEEYGRYLDGETGSIVVDLSPGPPSLPFWSDRYTLLAGIALGCVPPILEFVRYINGN